MPAPWDTKMATAAAAMDQALKLGGVVIQPPKPTATGFGAPPPSGEPDERP